MSYLARVTQRSNKATYLSLNRYDTEIQPKLGRPFQWNRYVPPRSSPRLQIDANYRGRGIGGSSAINFLLYQKPPQADIDAWEELGVSGWNWKRFDELVKRAETCVLFAFPSTLAHSLMNRLAAFTRRRLRTRRSLLTCTIQLRTVQTVLFRSALARSRAREKLRLARFVHYSCSGLLVRF